VTGGAGFIGSNVVRRLVEDHHQVVVLDDLSSGREGNLRPFETVNFLRGDVRDAPLVQRACTGVDVVFHLAASVGHQRSLADPVADAEVNVIGTLRVLEAARRAGVRKIVFSSSAAIFGELRTLPIREDHPAEPDTPYGASKLAAEKLCLAYARLYPPLEAVALRYFNVYGENQYFDAYGNVIPIFVHLLLHDRPLVVFGDGEQTRDFVNVRDVAEANVRAATATGVSGAFNVASGTRVTVNTVVEELRAVSGRPVRVEHGPPRKGDVRHSLADVSAAAGAFGFRPSVAFSHGLRDYVRWATGALA
jgi:UDP-glucose 4-epimerase